MILNPYAAEIKKEGDSIKLHESSEPMEEVSSSVVNSCLQKRKAELEPGKEEEEISDEKPKTERVPILQAPEWDVDNFDGLEYVSSPEVEISSEERISDEEEIDRRDFTLVVSNALS
ncbi:unnamed protein product [Cochlearia groenlandica]